MNPAFLFLCSRSYIVVTCRAIGIDRKRNYKYVFFIIGGRDEVFV